jgi:hypothetical protein
MTSTSAKAKTGHDTTSSVSITEMAKEDHQVDHRGDNFQLMTSSSLMQADTCPDPLSLAWVEDLINNPFNPYCSECLQLFRAKWEGSDVLVYEWNASSCGFTDLGFTTIYNCDGDTIQHCFLSIAGLTCDVDAMIDLESLSEKQLIWQCDTSRTLGCQEDLDISQLIWLNDTIEKYKHLCDVICVEGNSGNFVYKHTVDTSVILEFRTTCSDIVRTFYNCDGDELYRCFHFGFSLPTNCDLPFLPSLDDGELLWECTTTSIQSDLPSDKTLKFFPTLVTDQVVFSTEEPKTRLLTIYDAFGRTIESREVSSLVEVLSTSDWPVGTIFVKIKSNDIIDFIKLIKVQ